MKPKDVSVSVYESNGALKVNVSFEIPGTIEREYVHNIVPMFYRIDEKDRKRIQKQIAKELSKIELYPVAREVEFNNPVSVHISGGKALLMIDKHKEAYNKAESWMKANLPPADALTDYAAGALALSYVMSTTPDRNAMDVIVVPTWIQDLAEKVIKER
jgi:hypothetical protein